MKGTIRLAPGVQAELAESDAVFVVARAAGESGGPPLAVVKMLGAKLPMRYEVGQEDVLRPGQFFRGPVRVRVLVRRSGMVDAPGPADLEGEASGVVQPGADSVDILLRPES